MKRLMTFLLVLIMVLCLAACGEDATTPNNSDPTTQTTPSSTVTQPTSRVDNTVYNYRIRVVDQDGNPIEGATVMFCLSTCDFFMTDAEGWANINKPVADGYQAKILALPSGYEGYTFSEEYTNLEPGQTELTLVATKTAA